MEIEPNAVQVRGSLERPRGPAVVISAILVAVVLAIAKPWSFGQPGPPGTQSSSRPAGTPVSVASPPPPTPAQQVDPNGMSCLSGDVEQVVAFDRVARDEVRSWIAVEDAPVTGPLDQRLARITIHSSHVVGLGICGRFIADGLPVAARLLAIVPLATTPDGPSVTKLVVPQPITLSVGGPDAAVLYGPPPDTIASPLLAQASDGPSDGDLGFATWPMGQYALAFRFPSDRPNVVRWLGIDLLPSADAPR